MYVIDDGDEAVPVALPSGVEVRPLTAHADARGEVVEIFRSEWNSGVEPVQWNAVHSEANAIRGVHVHVDHWDYLVFLSGRTEVALIDLRRGSPTERMIAYLTVGSQCLHAVVIPPGVAHAFHAIEPSTHVYAVDRYWDPTEQFAVRWDDPDLGLRWTPQHPLLSPTDDSAGSLDDLLGAIDSHQPFDRIASHGTKT